MLRVFGFEDFGLLGSSSKDLPPWDLRNFGLLRNVSLRESPGLYGRRPLGNMTGSFRSYYGGTGPYKDSTLNPKPQP